MSVRAPPEASGGAGLHRGGERPARLGLSLCRGGAVRLRRGWRALGEPGACPAVLLMAGAQHLSAAVAFGGGGWTRRHASHPGRALRAAAGPARSHRAAFGTMWGPWFWRRLLGPGVRQALQLLSLGLAGWVTTATLLSAQRYRVPYGRYTTALLGGSLSARLAWAL